MKNKPEPEAPTEEKLTSRAIKACAQWLDLCVTELGWSKDQIPELEAMWWQYHDRNGHLKSNEN